MELVIDFSSYTPRELAEQIVEDLDDEKLKELVKEIDRNVQDWEFTAELANWFKKEIEEPEEPEDKPMFDTTRDDSNRNSPRRYR